MSYKSLFSFLILFFVFVVQVVAQQSDISGKYEGIADAQPFGKLNITAEIRNKDSKLRLVLVEKKRFKNCIIK